MVARRARVVVVTRPYVVLHHAGYGEAHFDLMLAVDENGPLLTWRLFEWPPIAATEYTPLPPHRRHYLTYEGDVSNDRGHVRRVANGVYESRQHGASDGVFEVDIAGHRIRLPLP